MSTLDRQNIEIFAQYLYRIEGCPEGRAKDHWLRAERQLSENLFGENRPVLVEKRTKSRNF